MRYETPAALRHAIDDRLRAEIRVATDPMRLRRRIVFERMLRRLEATSQGRWVLKGGMALEARYRERSRTTKDLDLALATELPTELRCTARSYTRWPSTPMAIGSSSRSTSRPRSLRTRREGPDGD